MTSPALQEIIALLGCPAAGNPAQYLFERAIEAAELDWRFITFDVAAEDVAAAVAGAAALGLRGCLVSGPLREACLRLVATASPSAEFAGSVSLLERRADGLSGLTSTLSARVCSSSAPTPAGGPQPSNSPSPARRDS